MEEKRSDEMEVAKEETKEREEKEEKVNKTFKYQLNF